MAARDDEDFDELSAAISKFATSYLTRNSSEWPFDSIIFQTHVGRFQMRLIEKGGDVRGGHISEEEQAAMDRCEQGKWLGLRRG